ncbi:hypothetical protein BTVI_43763 [Pitangus sulphuratus]|nr:hypothetical protein BTVI_43763 [Pitangus sulphuratus]
MRSHPDSNWSHRAQSSGGSPALGVKKSQVRTHFSQQFRCLRYSGLPPRHILPVASIPQGIISDPSTGIKSNLTPDQGGSLVGIMLWSLVVRNTQRSPFVVNPPGS